MLGQVRALVILLGLAATARADVPEPPCAGCTLDVPQRTTAMPLLVVMHGDHESAATAVARWKAPALARGWAVLGVQCDAQNKACRMGQWYVWNPKARWIEGLVDTVASELAIDPARVYLAGWSGGATYIGMHAHEWKKFAAVVFHGGGRKPPTSRCPDQLGAYFLMGAGNRFLKYTKQLADYWKRCKLEPVWDFQADVRNHAAEGRALDDAKAGEILDWLAQRTRARR